MSHPIPHVDMPIEGVRIIEKPNCSIIYIDIFSEEFRQIIRDQLMGVWSGFSEADSLPEFYSYKNTLTSFLERYNSKSIATQKGMIGELLSHVLLNYQSNGLTSLSIMKNKEEKSIKKGFDIIYCQIEEEKLWYAEVKSGRSETGARNSNQYNRILLNRAKRDIASKIAEGRNSLWESALYDVSAMIKKSEGQWDMKLLLSNDSPGMSSGERKNVILISALYHNLNDSIEEQGVLEFLSNTTNEDTFSGVTVISIQKNTYHAVADFLLEEQLNA